MTPLNFAARHLHQRVTAPGGLGGECVDLANVYMVDVLHLPERQLNAIDWAVAVPGLHWTPNGPVNYPPAGGLVVWHAYPPHGIGQAGHIAICLSADPLYLVSLDQNWPEHYYVALELHDYGGVAGWLSLERTGGAGPVPSPE
jgi:hypothetical protein